MKKEFEAYLKKRLEDFEIIKDERLLEEEFIEETNRLVKGLLDMYEATEDECFLNYAQPHIADILSYDVSRAAGMVKNILTMNANVNIIDELSIKKIHEVREFYKNHERNQYGIFKRDIEFELDEKEVVTPELKAHMEGLKQFSFSDLSRAFVFLAAYENKFNGHFGYEDIHKQLLALRQVNYCKRLNIYTSSQTGVSLDENHEIINATIGTQALMISTLVDTSEQIHEAIFEYYKGVRDLAKEAIVNYFELKANADQLVSDKVMHQIEKNVLFEMPMISMQALLAYGVVKAALLNIVSEKYALVGFEILKGVVTGYLNKEKNGTVERLEKHHFKASLGIIMSAYAIVLQAEKKGLLSIKEDVCYGI